MRARKWQCCWDTPRPLQGAGRPPEQVGDREHVVMDQRNLGGCGYKDTGGGAGATVLLDGACRASRTALGSALAQSHDLLHLSAPSINEDGVSLPLSGAHHQ